MMRDVIAGVLMCAALAAAAAPLAAAAQPDGLRIVVLEGEDGVNIIQQKTAVRPLVEVRDRNNLPVPGVLVTFSIEGGKAATFGGVSTLTVATNAAGQAAVTSLTPSAAGAFQIQVQAAFQGQVATATIAQTNVLTAAQAAAAGAATGGGSAGGAGGGAGGGGSAAGTAGGAAGGGGLSATTLGIVGAAVGGGALVATQVAGRDEAPPPSSFSGPLTGQIVSNITGRAPCTITRAVNGTMHIKLESQSASAVSGVAEIAASDVVTSRTCDGTTVAGSFSRRFTVTGSPGSLGFREENTETRPFEVDPRLTVTSVTSLSFVGALSGGVITGTLRYEEQSVTNGPESVFRETASGTFQVTLRP